MFSVLYMIVLWGYPLSLPIRVERGYALYRLGTADGGTKRPSPIQPLVYHINMVADSRKNRTWLMRRIFHSMASSRNLFALRESLLLL